MDHDLQDKRTNSIEANVISKSNKNDERYNNIKSQPCQIRSRKGYSPLNCYNRVNFARFPPTHNKKLIPIGVGCITNTSSPSANAVTMWYPDSGETTHITSNGKILNSSQKYMGSEKVVAAIGESMIISSSGKSKLTYKGKDFILDDIQVVPDASKTLLSIHQLCVDNPVSVEFNKQRVRIRDLATKEVIAEGKEEAGLYLLPMKTTKYLKALSRERISGDGWHARLGHLYGEAFKKMINNSIILSSYKTISDCDSCLRNKSNSLPHKLSTLMYHNLPQKVHRLI